MTALTEGRVTWTFGEGWRASKYDEWAFYLHQFQSCAGGGNKAVDVLALEPAAAVCWMIEAKDFTTEPRSAQKEDLWIEVARKARDTLAGVFAAGVCAVDEERRFARAACRAEQVRVVLHIEQPTNPSKLFPRSFDPADLRTKLRQAVRAIDPHALVVDCATRNLLWGAAWTAGYAGA